MTAPSQPTNFKFTNQGLTNADIDDVFVRKEFLYKNLPGSLWGVGSNCYGSLGDNSTIHKSSPVQTVSTGTNWRKVYTAGSSNWGTATIAIKTDGTLWTWGRNSCGVLGDNSSTHKSSPVQTVSTGTNWKQASVGCFTAGAVKTDGTLWMWGLSYRGNLANFDSTTRSYSSPIQTISCGTNWKQVSVGGSFSNVMAVKTDGTLWEWGGYGLSVACFRSSPVQAVTCGTNWKMVSSGGAQMGIKTDGTLWIWGANATCWHGAGNFSGGVRSSPMQTISTGTNWKTITQDMTRGSVAAIKTDGTLWLWGYNYNGQLGDNTRATQYSPVQTISTGTNWRDITMGAWGAVATKTDGTLWTWGMNARGQLGINSTSGLTTGTRSSPVQTVVAGTSWATTGSGGDCCGGAHFFIGTGLPFK